MISMKKNTLLIVILSFITIVFGEVYFGIRDNSFYEIYLKDKVIGYLDNKYEAKQVCASVSSNINNRLSETKLLPNDFKYKRIKNDVSISDSREIDKNIISSLNGTATLVKLTIGNETYGTIASQEEGKKVLAQIGENYIEKNNIDRNKILSMDIKSNIIYENVTENISKLDSVDNVAEKILFNNEEKQLVDIKVKYLEKKVEDIIPDTKIVRRDDMYIGESSEEKGEVGSKEVLSQITYVNGNKQIENILEENILKDAKSTIIYKGRKNPINDGIAFLQHPTRGGYITSTFGKRWGKNHNGIDIAHNEGDSVYSSFDGVIKEAHYENGYGNKILIEHEDNIETIYGHLSRFDVNVGDKVNKGQLIGKVGNTGRSTGPHLHFEVRVKGNPVDPTSYIEN